MASSDKLKKAEQYVSRLEYKLEIAQRVGQNQAYALAPPRIHDDHHDEHDDHNWGFENWPVAERLKILDSLSLNPFDYKDQPNRLLVLCFDMFNSLGLVDHFKIPLSTVQNFILVLRDRYRDVPFHNFMHAFNVAHSLYYFLGVCKAGDGKFSPLEKMSMLVAAFCHDIDHPGLNNAFQINCGSALAMIYNDTSVLEQHHCHEAFMILKRPDCNLFAAVGEDQYKLARKYITACILGTDLAEHGRWIDQFKQRRDNNFNWESYDDKKIAMICLVKCADISNEIRPSHIGRQWAEYVMTEFFIQVAIEKERGLPFAPHMDPDKTSLPASQVGFIQFLCLPLFTEVSKFFPLMDVCVKQMSDNKAAWQKIEDELKAKREAQQAASEKK